MSSTVVSAPRRSRALSCLAGVTALAVLATACSGGGGSKAPSIPAVPQPPSAQKGTAAVTFTMHWNGTTTSSSQRKPNYVPVSARSVSVTVNGSFATQCLNAPATTLTIDAPIGTDTFDFATYDAQNCAGTLLSKASVRKQIVIGAANTVTAVLNGVVASLAIALSNRSPNAGAATTVNVNVTAKDPDGNTILGPGDYSPAIVLAINDPTNSGTLTLSTTAIPNSSTAPTLTYSGGTLNSGLPGGPVATISASAPGATTQSAAFTPTPTIYLFTAGITGKPQWIAAGADGNMWFTESSSNKVAKITPAGAVTELSPPSPASDPRGIIGASDGNLWFTENATSKIVKLTTGGVFTEYNTPVPNDTPLLLVERGDGTIWYSGSGSNHAGNKTMDGLNGNVVSMPTANSSPFGIAAAADGNIYVNEFAADQLAQVPNTPSTVTEAPYPAGLSPAQLIRGPAPDVCGIDGTRACLYAILVDSAGTFLQGGVVKIDPFTFTILALDPPATANAFEAANSAGLAVGKDGAIWFTEPTVNKIGRVTTTGTMSDYAASPLPTAEFMNGIAAAPDGSVWFCEAGAGPTGRIGKLVY